MHTTAKPRPAIHAIAIGTPPSETVTPTTPFLQVLVGAAIAFHQPPDDSAWEVCVPRDCAGILQRDPNNHHRWMAIAAGEATIKFRKCNERKQVIRESACTVFVM